MFLASSGFQRLLWPLWRKIAPVLVTDTAPALHSGSLGESGSADPARQATRAAPYGQRTREESEEGGGGGSGVAGTPEHKELLPAESRRWRAAPLHHCHPLAPRKTPCSGQRSSSQPEGPLRSAPFHPTGQESRQENWMWNCPSVSRTCAVTPLRLAGSRVAAFYSGAQTCPAHPAKTRGHQLVTTPAL